MKHIRLRFYYFHISLFTFNNFLHFRHATFSRFLLTVFPSSFFPSPFPYTSHQGAFIVTTLSLPRTDCHGRDGSIYRKYRDISPISILSVSYRIGNRNIGFFDIFLHAKLLYCNAVKQKNYKIFFQFQCLETRAQPSRSIVILMKYVKLRCSLYIIGLPSKISMTF